MFRQRCSKLASRLACQMVKVMDTALLFFLPSFLLLLLMCTEDNVVQAYTAVLLPHNFLPWQIFMGMLLQRGVFSTLMFTMLFWSSALIWSRRLVGYHAFSCTVDQAPDITPHLKLPILPEQFIFYIFLLSSHFFFLERNRSP